MSAGIKQQFAQSSCMQGSWAEGESWWPASVYAVLPKGYLELRLEPTAMHPEVTALPSVFLSK